MTTRRGFIQGVLVGMVALVLPKTAEVSESDEPSVKLEHVIALDGMDSFIWPEHWSDGDYVFSDDIDGIDHITVELNDCILYSPTIFMIEDKTITLIAEGPLPSHCEIVATGDFTEFSRWRS